MDTDAHLDKEKINVLLVTADDKGLSERIKLEFHDHGDPFFDFRLTHAGSLQEGIRKIEKDSIDIVLLDLYLKDRQGLDTFQHFQSLSKSLPVVVLVPEEKEIIAHAAVRKGAQEYLVKGKIQAGIMMHVLRYAIDRKRLEERLIQSQKLETLGRLAGAVSHDLRNLIMVVLGYADLASDDFNDSASLSGNLQEIKKASLSANTLINQLLSFCRKQVTVLQVIDLNTLIKNMEGLLRRLIGSPIKMSVELFEESCLIHADPGHIEQILMNLIANARDAMPDGGSLVIKTEKRAFSQTTNAPAAKNVVTLSVKDSGIGMDRETQKRIFEPFFTTKGKYKGTGLGLSTVYDIVKQMNGQIDVYSQLGNGSIFKIQVFEAELPAGAAGHEPVEIPLSRGSETILVAEDDAPVRNLIKVLLKKNGYQVLEASHGLEAMEIAQTFKGVIHLLLTDSMMPHMGGEKLKDSLKAILPDTKVLMMTGYLSHQMENECPPNPGGTFLQKPFSEYELMSRIRHMLDSQS